MDKGTPGLTEALSGQSNADAIEREIEDIRQNLDNLVGELDHRRHQLNPVVVARHHPVILVVAGMALLGAAAGGVALVRAQRRKADSWSARGKRLSSAVACLVRNPDTTVPRAPSATKRVLAAAASAAAAVLAKRLVRRFLRPSP